MGDVYTKLQKIQAELKVPKSKYSEYGGYSYRSLEDIYEAVKPLLDRERLNISRKRRSYYAGQPILHKGDSDFKRHRKRGQFSHYSIRPGGGKQKRWVQHKLPAQHRATRENTR